VFGSEDAFVGVDGWHPDVGENDVGSLAFDGFKAAE
jgi:hypothetical protein